ncbi:amidase [Rhodococcus sp. X156]|uniref:amidase n=1 Tax=Rhodococcus sp. X156 TaxID=2499145 RepID=UPI000FD9E675|nr:amidase [Rhodococcus sp. X156]
MTDALRWTDAHGQAQLVADGELTPLELVDAAIERIERLDPQVNAVVSERFEQARAEASADLPDGPFRGVPLLLKDIAAHSTGDPLYAGTSFLRERDWRSDHDSAFVARLKRAGFVILGKTTTPELAGAITTEPLATGPTRNPWDTARSTGGSSGGAAAVVAAGMVPVAHGSDGGGSIRIPASECGLVGLKPTRARVSMAPDAGEGWMGLSAHGVLSRTVRDTAALLDVMSGAEPGDPYPAPPLARPLAAEVGADPGRLRIGVLDHPAMAGASADPDAAAAVNATAKLLAELGHHVEVSHPAAMGDTDLWAHYGAVVSSSMAAEADRWAEVLGTSVDTLLEPVTAGSVTGGRAITAAQLLATTRWINRYQRRMATWWAEDGFDVLLSPVLNGVPPEIGWLTHPEQRLERTVQLLQYTPQLNITGQPAISLPLHWTAGGLPVGVQLAGAYGREDVLVRLAAQLEQAQPWADRHPPL